MSNRLSFNRGLAYQGTNAVQPPECHFEDRDPTQYDTQGVSLLDFWLNENTQAVWVLVSLAGNSHSNGSLATWVRFGMGDIQLLTSNSGGAVGPDAMFNVNVVGDGTTITGVGNPGTHTITLSTVGTGVISTLTGNSGGAVSPTAGNINVVGDTTTINIVGNPATHTLTASTTGSVPVSFHTDSGNATPALGIIIFNAVSQAGSSVSFSGAGNTVSLNTTDAGGNVIIGSNGGNNTLTGTANTGVGFTNLHSLTTGSNNTVFGDLAAQTLTTGGSNVIVGKSAATGLTTGSSNIVIGTSAGSNLTGAEGSNILIGEPGVTGTSSFIGITIPGSGAPFISNFGTDNTFVGQSSGNKTTTGSGTNTGLGFQALNAVTTGNANTALGSTALVALTTGNGNIAIGTGSGRLITSGGSNMIIGNLAGIAMTSANFNVIIGAGSGDDITTGVSNTIVGTGSGITFTTGNRNIIIGQDAGNAITGAESDNIYLNNTGVVGESNVMRLGTSGGGAGGQSKTFIAAVRGVTTDVNDAIAVLISSTGQLGTVSSSARVKENIKDMGSSSEDIYKLRPVTFQYKNRFSPSKSYGLIAEEVHDVFPDLVVYDVEGKPESVKYHDLPALLLNEVIKLKQELEVLKKKLS